MAVTKKEIFITSAVVFGSIILYAVYRNKRGNDISSALEDYINKSYTETDISKGGDEAISDIGKIKIDFNKMHIGNLYGKYSNPAIRNELAKTVTELWASMKGAGTDLKPFYQNFSKIKNKNTMAFIDTVYKAMHGEGLFQAMKGEISLNNSQYGQFSDKNPLLSNIPFINSYWHPTIAKYLTKLPNY